MQAAKEAKAYGPERPCTLKIIEIFSVLREICTLRNEKFHTETWHFTLNLNSFNNISGTGAHPRTQPDHGGQRDLFLLTLHLLFPHPPRRIVRDARVCIRPCKSKSYHGIGLFTLSGSEKITLRNEKLQHWESDTVTHTFTFTSFYPCFRYFTLGSTTRFPRSYLASRSCISQGEPYEKEELSVWTHHSTITPFIHPLYPFLAAHTPMYTRYTCMYTIYTPNTPLHTSKHL